MLMQRGAATGAAQLAGGNGQHLHVVPIKAIVGAVVAVVGDHNARRYSQGVRTIGPLLVIGPEGVAARAGNKINRRQVQQTL